MNVPGGPAILACGSQPNMALLCPELYGGFDEPPDAPVRDFVLHKLEGWKDGMPNMLFALWSVQR